MSGPVTTAWAALVTAAVLGTDRRPLPPAPGPPFDVVPAGADPAVTLLDRAAALAVARRAGARPRPAPPPLPLCPPDGRRPCPPVAAHRLGQLLATGDDVLLPEWVERAAEAGIGLPPEHVVGVLEAAAAGRVPVGPALAVAGPLAPWLAAALPGGAAAELVDPPDLEEAWRTGRPRERLRALRALRRLDPRDARERLAEAWPALPGPERAALLEALAEGLGPDDELFLEVALADQALGVRRAAVALLARLPSSGLARRMAERLGRLVVLERRPGGLALALHDPPRPLPAHWRRDLPDSRPPAGVPEAAWVVGRVAALAPLPTWDQWGTPTEVVAAVVAAPDPGPVLDGLREAARREGHPAWAAALLEPTGDLALGPFLDPADALRIARRGATVERIIAPATRAALARLPHPWPADLVDAVIAALVAWFRQGRAWLRGPDPFVPLVAHFDPAGLLPLLEALQPVGCPAAITASIWARHQMLEELS